MSAEVFQFQSGFETLNPIPKGSRLGKQSILTMSIHVFRRIRASSKERFRINQKYPYGILRLNLSSVEAAQHVSGAIQEYIKHDV